MIGLDRERWVSELLDRLEAPLLRYAVRLVGELETARDMVQDAFLRLCRQEAGPLIGREREWLYAVVRNRAIDHLRKEGRMHATDAERFAETPGEGAGPEAGMQAADRGAFLRQHVDRLPPRDQELLRLKFQDGLSYAAIAEITGLSISHVGVILHHAIRKLRERLAPYEGSLA